MALLVLRVVISLGVVLGLFWMVARTGSRKLGGRDRALLRVRGRQALTRGSSVAVVEVGNRVLVVGVSDGGVRLLTEMTPEDLVLEHDPEGLEPGELPELDAEVELAPASFEAHLLRAEADAYEQGFRSGYDADPAPAAAALTSAPAAPTRIPASRTRRVPRPPSSQPSRQQSQPQGALSGSLLSGATWRQAWGTATGRAYSRPRDGDAA